MGGVVTGIVLHAAQGATLVVSYIGYTPKEFSIGAQSVYNVSIVEDTQKLEEVVVVGYGTQKKVNLTGAISVLKGEDLTKRQVGQSSLLLQGAAPGVTVTQSSGQPGKDGGTIQIRGIGTLSDANPLILVGGIEMSINNIDPNMIESISVLKDAASSAIYGSRAANGVILVTTKRAGTKKPTINYNGYVGIQQLTDLPKKVGAIDHMTLMDEAYTNTGKNPIYTDLLEEYKMYGATNPDKYPNTDWQKGVLRTGFTHNHFVSLSAGNENLKLLASAGYLGQNGNLVGTSFERITLRLNTDVRFSAKLTAKFDIFLRQNKTTQPEPSNGRGINDILFQMNRIPADLPGVFTNGNYGMGALGYNPIAWTRDGGASVATVPNAMMNFNLIYTPVEWITIDAQYAPYLVYEHDKDYMKSITLYNYDGTVYREEPAKTTLNEEFNKTVNYTIKGSILAEKRFSKHNVKLLLGASRESYSNYWFSAYRENFQLPRYDVINAGGESNKNNAGSGGGWALQSFFGRLNYDYDGRYLFEANGRYDGSSRFNDGNKYSFFPSLSAGWRVSEEAFMEKVKDGFLSNLKLRLSWGQLGNQNIGKVDGFINTSGIMPFYNGGTVFEMHKDRYTMENKNLNAMFPRFTIGESNNHQNSTYWMRSAAYLKLSFNEIF